MKDLNYKHLIAVVIGMALSLAASHFGLDLSQSCPPAPKAPEVAK